MKPVLGCKEVKDALRTMLLMEDPSESKLFITGPTGSGKSYCVSDALRWVVCEAEEEQKPCMECEGCRAFARTRGKSCLGLYVEFEYGRCSRPLQFLKVACDTTTLPTLERDLDALRWSLGRGLTVIHFEEAAQLRRDRLDERLFDLLDDPDFKSCHWIATAVNDKELNPQFNRRWIPVVTSPPTMDELTCYIADRCGELGIDSRGDAQAIRTIARRSQGLVSQADRFLNRVMLHDPPVITRSLIESHEFPPDDPWGGRFLGS